MPALERPSAISVSTSSLPDGQRCEVLDASSGTGQLGDHFRVERCAAGSHPGQRIGELGDVRDAVLQQIADAGRAAGEQSSRILRLDVLGEEQQRRCRDGRGGSLSRREGPHPCAFGGMRMSTTATSGWCSATAAHSATRRPRPLALRARAR
jgi:hypothetical protein